MAQGAGAEPSEAVVDFVTDARYGDLEDVQAALAAGVEVNSQSYDGATALLMACANGHLEVMKTLLEAKANTKIGNEAGNTPLHWASLNGHVAIVEALLQAKADPDAKNEFQRRPFDEALGRDMKDVCELLCRATDFSKDIPPGSDDQKDDEEEKDADMQKEEKEALIAKLDDEIAKAKATKAKEEKKAKAKEEEDKAKAKDQKTTDKKERAADAEEDDAQKKATMKKVIKEGGKRGVEIQGASEMGGLAYFCTSVDEPLGDLSLLQASMDAMNAEVDESAEERKGGAGGVAKMIYSCNNTQLAIVANMPAEKADALTAKAWVEHVIGVIGGKLVEGSNTAAQAVVPHDEEKGRFPIKMKDEGIAAAFALLREKALIPAADDDDDDDDIVFGDDDFPSS